MWSYSEAAIEPLSCKRITYYFLTTRVEVIFSKAAGLNYPRGHMASFQRRYEVYTASHRLCIDVETTLSVKGDATLQKNDSVKSIFLVLSALKPNSYDVQKVLENT